MPPRHERPHVRSAGPTLLPVEGGRWMKGELLQGPTGASSARLPGRALGRLPEADPADAGLLTVQERRANARGGAWTRTPTGRPGPHFCAVPGGDARHRGPGAQGRRAIRRARRDSPVFKQPRAECCWRGGGGGLGLGGRRAGGRALNPTRSPTAVPGAADRPTATVRDGMGEDRRKYNACPDSTEARVVPVGGGRAGGRASPAAVKASGDRPESSGRQVGDGPPTDALAAPLVYDRGIPPAAP